MLCFLFQEIDSLRSVIELRSAENRQLQCTNEKLAERIEHHAWLETELEKAKHRLEELSLIVQNKMVSERYIYIYICSSLCDIFYIFTFLTSNLYVYLQIHSFLL